MYETSPLSRSFRMTGDALLLTPNILLSPQEGNAFIFEHGLSEVMTLCVTAIDLSKKQSLFVRLDAFYDALEGEISTQFQNALEDCRR